jgi:hypothetical protein
MIEVVGDLAADLVTTISPRGTWPPKTARFSGVSTTLNMT